MANVLFQAEDLIVARLQNRVNGFNARLNETAREKQVSIDAVNWDPAAGQFCQSNVAIELLEMQNKFRKLTIQLFNISGQVTNRTASQMFSGRIGFGLHIHVPHLGSNISPTFEVQQTAIRQAVLLTFNHRDVWTWASPLAYGNDIQWQSSPLVKGSELFRQSHFFQLMLTADQR